MADSMTSPYPVPPEPSWRKPAGILLILLLIALWLFLVTSAVEWLAGQFGGLPGWVEMTIFVIAGIIWIFPMRPLLIWMEGAPK